MASLLRSARLPLEISTICHAHLARNMRVYAHGAYRQYTTNLDSKSLRNVPGSFLPDLPKFYMRSDNIQVLTTPRDFYDFLLKSIKRAKRRIFLTSLYVGKDGKELIQALHDALKENEDLELYILTDYFRSTREHPKGISTASFLAPLQAAFPNRVRLSLYHTPALHGLLKKVIPKRYNEGWGLWHGKIYGFDDDVVLSGANLSKDYFTNRQDRAIAFQNHSEFADYLQQLCRVFMKHSYAIKAKSTSSDGDNFDLTWQGGHGQSAEPSISPKAYTEEARQTLIDFMELWNRKNGIDGGATTPVDSDQSDTLVQPFLQVGTLGIKQETDNVIPALLDIARQNQNIRLDWTSGYFSLRDAYKQGLLRAKGPVNVVCASPEANGFYQSAGFSKYIPPAYTYLEEQFWKAIKRNRKIDTLKIKEWRREGWTYHSKGIWLSEIHNSDTDQGEATLQPFLTLIGSSNYGYRSAARDVEINASVCTTSPTLQKALGDELRNIRQHATVDVNDELFQREDRKVGPINKLAARLIADML